MKEMVMFKMKLKLILIIVTVFYVPLSEPDQIIVLNLTVTCSKEDIGIQINTIDLIDASLFIDDKLIKVVKNSSSIFVTLNKIGETGNHSGKILLERNGCDSVNYSFKYIVKDSLKKGVVIIYVG